VGRQTIWLPIKIPGIRPDFYEYRLTDSKIRNGSHNNIKDQIDGEHVYVTLESDDGEREQWNKREVIALAHRGPPEWRCWVCTQAIDVQIVILHRNGDLLDCAPDNLAYLANPDHARAHELQCLEVLMSLPPVARAPRSGFRVLGDRLVERPRRYSLAA
jgi:hypothetical protein